jgi:hypothetical protein
MSQTLTPEAGTATVAACQLHPGDRIILPCEDHPVTVVTVSAGAVQGLCFCTTDSTPVLGFGTSQQVCLAASGRDHAA